MWTFPYLALLKCPSTLYFVMRRNTWWYEIIAALSSSLSPYFRLAMTITCGQKGVSDYFFYSSLHRMELIATETPKEKVYKNTPTWEIWSTKLYMDHVLSQISEVRDLIKRQVKVLFWSQRSLTEIWGCLLTYILCLSSLPTAVCVCLKKKTGWHLDLNGLICVRFK